MGASDAYNREQRREEEQIELRSLLLTVAAEAVRVAGALRDALQEGRGSAPHVLAAHLLSALEALEAAKAQAGGSALSEARPPP